MTTIGGTDEEPLRIGILCDGDTLAAWQVECIRLVQRLTFACLVVVLVNSQPAAPRPAFLERLRRKLASGLLLWRVYERLVLDRKLRAARPTPLPDELRDVPRIECTPVQHGRFRQSIDPQTLSALKSHEPDVLLRFGFGILTGEILSAARFGIWSYHHGDPERFRGAPPGFWEIHNGDPVTGVVLQRLTEDLDAGVILQSGWFKTDRANYARSLDQILFGAAHFVAKALGDLRRNPQRLLNPPPITRSGPVYRYPRTAAMLRFFLRSLRAWARDQVNSLFRHQQWTLGRIDEPVAALYASALNGRSVMEGVDWLPEMRGRFLADPFVLEGDKPQVLAEEFDWRSGTGHIATVSWPGSGEPVVSPAIRNGFHLSYPFVLEQPGGQYCVPECAESNLVNAYRWHDARNELVEEATVLRGFPALDSTIFEHDGQWWLFCTSAEAGANDHLFAWYADEPFGSWTAHRSNPLKVDIRSARPAGRPFVYDGKLIRPAQDCSTHYGAAIVFNHVTKLTTDEFAETPVARIEPDPAGRYPAGLHTINSFGEHTIIDGARWTWVAAQTWRELGRKFELGKQR